MRLRSRLAFLVASVAVAAAPLVGVRPALADPIDVPLPPLAWTKTVGTLQVQKYGSGSPALVLVPGLASGAWTWNGTIAREAKTHAIYAVTVGGFAGVPPAQPQTLEGIVASLATLVTSEKLDRPVLVGHSLGGTTVLQFGIEHGDLARAIVTVDGTPVFPNVAGQSADERATSASTFGAAIAAQTPAQFLAGERTIAADYVTDPAVAEHVATLAAKSDQASVAAYITALIASDLRPQLPKLTLPTLLIAPVPAPPLPSYLPASMAALDDAAREASTLQFYTLLFAGAPNLKIAKIAHARHFAMLDQPDAFATALDGFLGALK